jgi:hypothetical protein
MFTSDFELRLRPLSRHFRRLLRPQLPPLLLPLPPPPLLPLTMTRTRDQLTRSKGFQSEKWTLFLSQCR